LHALSSLLSLSLSLYTCIENIQILIYIPLYLYIYMHRKHTDTDIDMDMYRCGLHAPDVWGGGARWIVEELVASTFQPSLSLALYIKNIQIHIDR